ncbi:hypothetical protein [Nostoc sp. PCC 7524]|uniref:hypothetical protein n=1 Tax=Nostoc sp. (strain ATCC 29411 / PCC 7524) TaxID=28072 RepID=UPI001494EC1D|nr:hypothetical protein [Nostoc sp. PCC 7524]
MSCFWVIKTTLTAKTQLKFRAIAQSSWQIKAIARNQLYALIQYLCGLLNLKLSQLD